MKAEMQITKWNDFEVKKWGLIISHWAGEWVAENLEYLDALFMCAGVSAVQDYIRTHVPKPTARMTHDEVKPSAGCWKIQKWGLAVAPWAGEWVIKNFEYLDALFALAGNVVVSEYIEDHCPRPWGPAEWEYRHGIP